MVLIEIAAITQWKRFKKSRLGKPIVELAHAIDPDRTLRRLSQQRRR